MTLPQVVLGIAAKKQHLLRVEIKPEVTVELRVSCRDGGADSTVAHHAAIIWLTHTPVCSSDVWTRWPAPVRARWKIAAPTPASRHTPVESSPSCSGIVAVSPLRPPPRRCRPWSRRSPRPPKTARDRRRCLLPSQAPTASSVRKSSIWYRAPPQPGPRWLASRHHKKIRTEYAGDRCASPGADGAAFFNAS